MAELTLAIRLTADGKGLVGEVRGSAGEFKKRSAAAQQLNFTARQSAARCFAQLNRQVEALGKLRAQTLAYEASRHPLTAARCNRAI
jgi:hypothetical protein